VAKARTVQVHLPPLSAVPLIATPITAAQSQPNMPAMPESDPKYLRPSIHQSIAVELDILAKAVASGDLTQVKALVKLHPTVTYVTNGLLTAVNRDQPQIGEYLLNRVNVIDRDVVAMVVRKKELRWFEMLTKRGWDVNTPVLDGIPALWYVIFYSIIIFMQNHRLNTISTFRPVVHKFHGKPL